jgi:hypothetical protein
LNDDELAAVVAALRLLFARPGDAPAGRARSRWGLAGRLDGEAQRLRLVEADRSGWLMRTRLHG